MCCKQRKCVALCLLYSHDGNDENCSRNAGNTLKYIFLESKDAEVSSFYPMPVSNPDVIRPSEVPLPPSQRSFFLAPIPGILHHPLATLAWQLLSCASAWSFVIVLARNGEIPLSDALASLISQNPTETTLIVTLVATILSTPTTWYFRFAFLCSMIETSLSADFPCRFFYAAVRRAVVSFLSRRVSLFQLCSAIEFSIGCFVLNKRHIRWSISTILCVGLLGTLTSAYVMLNLHNHVLLSIVTHEAGPLLSIQSLSI